MIRSCAVRVAIALALAGLAASTPVASGAAWSAPIEVAYANVYQAQVAGVPGGGFLVTWETFDSRLHAAWIDATGAVAPRQDVAGGLGSQNWLTVGDPQLGTHYVVKRTRRPRVFAAQPGGTFAALPLTYPVGSQFLLPEVYAAAGGGRILLWDFSQVLAGAPGGPMVRVPLPDDATVDAAVALPDGSALVLFDRGGCGCHRRRAPIIVKAARYGADGTLGRAHVIARGHFGGLSAGGLTLVPWRGGAVAKLLLAGRYEVAAIDPAGRLLRRTRTRSDALELAAGAGGDVLVYDAAERVRTWRVGATGELESRQRVAGRVSLFDTTAAVDEHGAAILLGADPRVGRARAALAPAGGPFSPFARALPRFGLSATAGAAAGTAAIAYKAIDEQNPSVTRVHLRIITSPLG